MKISARKLLAAFGVAVLLSACGGTGGVSAKKRSIKSQENGKNDGEPEGPPTAATTSSCKTLNSCTVPLSQLKYLTNDEYRNAVIDLLGIPESVAIEGTAGWASPPRIYGFDTIEVSSVNAKSVEDRSASAEKFAEAARSGSVFKSCFEGDDANVWSSCKDRLLSFLARAFRHSLTAEEKARWAKLFTDLKKLNSDNQQEGPEKGALEGAIMAALVSPEFLVKRPERGNYALASRLSFALGVTVPSERLLKAAEAGSLSSAKGVKAEAEAILADEVNRKRFVKNFFAKWLSVDALSSTPDSVKVGNIPARDFYREFEATFANLIETNAPLKTLMSPGYTAINKRLSAHYGIDAGSGATDDAFAKVPSDERGSFLQMGAFHYLNRSETDSKPIQRGLTVLRSILCETIAPLTAAQRAENDRLNKEIDSEGDKPANVVEHWDRIAQKNSSCMACHSKINPMGFPLEAYGPDGKFRTQYANGSAVRYTASFLGDTISSPREMIDVLVKRPEFYSCFYSKVFAYLSETPPAARPDLSKQSALLERLKGVGVRDLVIEIVTSARYREPTARQ